MTRAMLRSFPPPGSVITFTHVHTIHSACTHNLLQTKEQKQIDTLAHFKKEKKTQRNPSSNKKRQKKKWLYSYQVFWFGSRPHSLTPGRLATADSGAGGTRDVTIRRSSGGERPPGASVIGSSWLVGTFVLRETSYKWNLNAAFVYYNKICNVTKKTVLRTWK